MTTRTVWKQVECLDGNGKLKLTGMIKIDVTAKFIPLSDLSVKKMILENEKTLKKL
jgi:hypothetical protein